MLEIAFELLAETGDELVAVVDDDGLRSAEHGEAAEFIEHFGQFGAFAIDVEALGVLGRTAMISRRRWVCMKASVPTRA